MSTRDVREPTLFDYKRLLTGYFRANPAWRDLADAATPVLNSAVHRYRRQLARVRDSQALRIGDFIEEIVFDPAGADDWPTDADGDAVPLAEGTRITNAKIKAIQQFSSAHGEGPTTDYADVEFVIGDGRVLSWRMPLDAGVHQERSVLMANASMMGFDFFSKGFSNDDYRRLYDFVSHYWPEGGTNNFVRFIAFVKNIKLDMVSLWSRDDDTDGFPFLEPRHAAYVPAWKGGDHYQTSHVELRYFPNDIPNIDALSMDDLKDLFYYLAPIHLVLERIVGVIEGEFEIFTALAAQEAQIIQAKWAFKHEFGDSGHTLGDAAQSTAVMQGVGYYVSPIMRGDLGQGSSGQSTAIDHGFDTWVAEVLDLETPVGLVVQEFQTMGSKSTWVAPVLGAWWDVGVAGAHVALTTAKKAYEPPPLVLAWTQACEGQSAMRAEQRCPWVAPPLVLDGWMSEIATQLTNRFSARHVVDQVPFPELTLNALFVTPFGFSATLILSTTVALNAAEVPVAAEVGGGLLLLVAAKYRSARGAPTGARRP